MPTRFQAALGHRIRGQRVPILRLLWDFVVLVGCTDLFMYRLPVNSNTACVPHTPYTLVLKFVPSAGRVYGVATHAVGGDAGYGLLMTRNA